MNDSPCFIFDAVRLPDRAVTVLFGLAKRPPDMQIIVARE